jgi:hypothetical protein
MTLAISVWMWTYSLIVLRISSLQMNIGTLSKKILLLILKGLIWILLDVGLAFYNMCIVSPFRVWHVLAGRIKNLVLRSLW